MDMDIKAEDDLPAKKEDEWAARHPDRAWYILTLTCVATLTISGQSQKKYEIYSKKY
jgi:hypothetical protein